MRCLSEWHPEHSCGTFSAKVMDVVSETFLMSCTPWQSEQTATRASLVVSRRWPWTLDQYLAYSSVGSPDAFILSTLPWALAFQSAAIWACLLLTALWQS